MAEAGGDCDFSGWQFPEDPDRTLEANGFSNVTFKGYVYFQNVCFRGNADFSNASFSEEVTFNVANFSGTANFSNASFNENTGFYKASFNQNAYFNNSRFDGDAYFNASHFDGYVYFNNSRFNGHTYFSDASFGGYTNFSDASFSKNTNFRNANFSGNAYFRNASFNGYTGFRDASFNGSTYFGGASLSGYTNFSRAIFSGYAGFEFKDVKTTIFNNCDLQKISLTGSNLSNADLRNVLQPQWKNKIRQGKELHKWSQVRALGYLPNWLIRIFMLRQPFPFVLDDTQIRNTRFSSRSADPWTTLRRSYSGPMFAIHFLLLVAFLLPLVSKTAFWVTIGRAEEAVNQNEKVQKLLEKVEPAQEKGTNIIEKTTGKSLHWEETRVGWILVGWHSGWLLFVLALCGIAYNGLRFWLTYKVGLLRDREQQSDRSPGKDEYLTGPFSLFNLHIAASYLVVPLLLFFFITFLSWVAQPVYILVAG
jgi:uncharacterized protein YjbI with pentapeptide repeats